MGASFHVSCPHLVTLSWLSGIPAGLQFAQSASGWSVCHMWARVTLICSAVIVSIVGGSDSTEPNITYFHRVLAWRGKLALPGRRSALSPALASCLLAAGRASRWASGDQQADYGNKQSIFAHSTWRHDSIFLSTLLWTPDVLAWLCTERHISTLKKQQQKNKKKGISTFTLGAL